MSIYDQMAPPPEKGDFPPTFKFEYPGASITGVITAMSIAPAKDGFDASPVLQIQQGAETWSVFCGPTVLYRELWHKRPQIGQTVTITFTGLDGRTKLFTLDVHDGAAPVPQGPPPAAVPQGQPAWGAPPAQPPAQPAWGAPSQPAAAPPAQPAWGSPSQQ